MAMGDLNSVEFGQQAHVLLALTLGLNLSDFLIPRGRFPRQDWGIGIAVDDVVFVEKVPRLLPGSGVSSMLADAMVEAHKSVGLVPHDWKRFRLDQTAKFWGITVEGERGVIRPIGLRRSEDCSYRVCLQEAAGDSSWCVDSFVAMQTPMHVPLGGCFQRDSGSFL